eukprot:15850074-Heterocapsa_arctica.AAC.1
MALGDPWQDWLAIVRNEMVLGLNRIASDEQLCRAFPTLKRLYHGHDAYDVGLDRLLPATPFVQMLWAHVEQETGLCASDIELARLCVDCAATAMTAGFTVVPVLPLTVLAHRHGWHQAGVRIAVDWAARPGFKVETCPLSTAGSLGFRSSFDRVSTCRPPVLGVDDQKRWASMALKCGLAALDYIDPVDYDHYSSGGRIVRHRVCTRAAIDVVKPGTIAGLLGRLPSGLKTAVWFRGRRFCTSLGAVSFITGLKECQDKADIPRWCRLHAVLYDRGQDGDGDSSDGSDLE